MAERPAPLPGAASKLETAPGLPSGRRPVQSVLFACGQNAVRSPMAEALARAMLGDRIFVASAGVRLGEPDPFVAAVLGEIGLAPGPDGPKTIEELDEIEAFDLIVTLAPEAHHRALDLTRVLDAEVEYWPTFDPTVVAGSRDQRLDAYREVREALAVRIRARFGVPAAGLPQPPRGGE